MKNISALLLVIVTIFSTCNKKESLSVLTITNTTNQNFEVFGVPECDGDSKSCVLAGRNFTVPGYDKLEIRSDKKGVFNLRFLDLSSKVEQSTLYFKGEQGKKYAWNYGDPADQIREIVPSSGSGNTGGNCDLSYYKGQSLISR